jgi:uroporphyrinogen decarboxylase
MSNFLCDLAMDTVAAERILDRLLELKKRYWAMVLDELGDLIDVVVENDDYGTQQSQLISPTMYHALFEPRLRDLVGFVKRKHAERRGPDEPGYFFFHSCGNVRPYLPSFIDMGVDVLNPVHVSAKGMDPAALKRDFGRDITFWGGGVETQHVLPHGTPDEVRRDVRRNVEALMPGGGFVFNTVHNIQAEVPPENVMAMWETLREVGIYTA